MVGTGWHGGWGNFHSVEAEYFGSGEGDSQGWGFYVSEHRKGGEYFAKYARSNKGDGFLHKVEFEIPESEYWYHADRTPLQLGDGRVLTYDDYRQLRMSEGDLTAAHFLINNGVKAFTLWETDKPTHGYTTVVLEPSIIRVLESHKLIHEPVACYWVQIA